MNSFIGHEKNWQTLTNDFLSKKLPPAYLFYGTSGIGKRKVAESWVQFCFGREISNHPDLWIVDGSEKQIRIDEIRALQAPLNRAPLEANLKMVILDQVQNMTLQAANSLLKTLEEPPSDTVFILIAPTLFGVLPTIRSRCRRLYFMPPPLEKAAQLVKKETGCTDEETHFWLEGVNGSPGQAIKVNDENFKQALRSLETVVSKPLPFSEISARAQQWAQSEINLILLLEILKKKIFQTMVDQQNWNYLEKIDRITVAQKDLDRNVNKQLIFENLLMGL